MSTPPARSGAYDPERSVRSRLSFPLPDVSWEVAAPYWEGAAAGETLVLCLVRLAELVSQTAVSQV